MHRIVLTLVATVAFTGSAFAQAKHTATKSVASVRGAIADSSAKKANPKAADQKASVAHSAARPTVKQSTRQQVRATRYGGFMMAPPPSPPPPPQLDTSSPRTLNLTNANTGEALTVTYWSDGAYRRDALDKLNHFLRDWRESAETEMDPLLFDVLWHTQMHVGFNGSVEVLSAYRSPTTNAWLASVSRGVAGDSQHMNGNAMDISMPGVPVFRVQQVARSLGIGGVGFYPRSGFIHIDTGPVRYW